MFARAPRSARALALLAALAAIAAVPASAPAAIPTAAPALKKGTKNGICIAQIVRKGKLVPLRQSVYRYRFVRITRGRNKGRFRRTIVQVTEQVRTSCLTQCVQVKQRDGAMQAVYRIRRVYVREPRHGRLVRVKRLRRVWLLGPCASLPSIDKLGTSVTVTVLPDSALTFDFSAFKRDAPVTGALHGYVPGKILDGADNQVILTSGTLELGRTTMFSDKVCGGAMSDSIRTGDTASVKLDESRQSTLTLGDNGTLAAVTYMVLQIPFELRNGDDGCAKPYVTTGYTTASETIRLNGSRGAAGLAQVPIKMAPSDIDLVGCLSPGLPSTPCNGFELPLPATVSMRLNVSVVAS